MICWLLTSGTPIDSERIDLNPLSPRTRVFYFIARHNRIPFHYLLTSHQIFHALRSHGQ